MTVEHYAPSKHNRTLLGWWASRGVDVSYIDWETFSPFGAVVSDDAGPCMAGWLYLPMGCRTCFVERLVARPGNSISTARDAGAELFEYLRKIAIMHGYKETWTHIERKGLAERAGALGFEVTNENVAILRKDLTTH